MNKKQAIKEAMRCKQYFPYRIVLISFKDGKHEVHVCKTKARGNNLMRKGYQVWEINL